MVDPVTLWLAAVGAAATGARGRVRPATSAAAWRATGRIARRLPLPSGLRTMADSPMLRADVATLEPDGVRLDEIVAIRVAAACLAGAVTVVGALTAPALMIIGPALGGVGYAMPAVAISRRARRRRAAVVAGLPDLIDVVVLCAQAGMPLEAALRLACERMPGPCSGELTTALEQMALGTPRRVAYRNLADRVGASELRGLVGALIQADELGTPVAAVLARQAETIRAARRRRVQDSAARAAPKVQLVVAMVMVPGVLVVVVGVMVLQLVGQLGAVTGAMP